MEELIEQLTEKVNGCGINTKAERMLRGAYCDALVMAKEALNIHLVSEMFEFAGYLYGNFDYHDNTKDGDIYIHNDNGLKYTRDKIYQQWIGIRNSR